MMKILFSSYLVIKWLISSFVYFVKQQESLFKHSETALQTDVSPCRLIRAAVIWIHSSAWPNPKRLLRFVSVCVKKVAGSQVWKCSQSCNCNPNKHTRLMGIQTGEACKTHFSCPQAPPLGSAPQVCFRDCIRKTKDSVITVKRLILLKQY